MDGARAGWQCKGWVLGLALALLAGAGLRLIWADDIEYKSDEAWTFAQTQQFAQDAQLPWLGMPTSLGMNNPGMSVWVFDVISMIADVQDPVALARCVQILNIVALFMMVGIALWIVPAEEREVWLWAVALAALNPLAMIFQRKIWPPCVLPMLTLIMLACWWQRSKSWAAFGWGLISACIGQIHLSGFFFAGGFFVWSLLFRRELVRWRYWLAGCVIGALPMIPWVIHAATHRGPNGMHHISWKHIFEFRYWIYWTCEPLGVCVGYSLGDDFLDYLGSPWIGGRPTCLNGLINVLMLVSGVTLLARGLMRCWKNRAAWMNHTLPESPTLAALGAAICGGLLFTFSFLPVHRHYVLVAYPLMYVWLVQIALAPASAGPVAATNSRRWLGALCLMQLLVSISFLDYVHRNQRVIRGDYCMPYGAQIQKVAPHAAQVMTVLP